MIHTIMGMAAMYGLWELSVRFVKSEAKKEAKREARAARRMQNRRRDEFAELMDMTTCR